MKKETQRKSNVGPEKNEHFFCCCQISNKFSLNLPLMITLVSRLRSLSSRVQQRKMELHAKLHVKNTSKFDLDSCCFVVRFSNLFCWKIVISSYERVDAKVHPRPTVCDVIGCKNVAALANAKIPSFCRFQC